jgi:branched-chain amino acid transport system ATP-binding protein
VEPILSVNSVQKNFGGLQAVQNLSLQVLPGQVCGLIGPNGAGKTTVFNLITGVYPCSRGSIQFGDIELTRLKPYQIVRRGVARTFQTIRLFQNLTTWEHVLVGQNVPARLSRQGTFSAGATQKTSLKEEAEKILNLLGLWEVRSWKASNLPYGIQRKVEIARALATRPRLLLLDEPAAGLNIQETADLQKTLHKIRGMGLTLLVIEHDMRVIMGVCDFIFVLNFGQKIAEGTPGQIRANEQVIEAYLGREG